MKKIIFKTAIIAALVMVLMSGNAMAAKISGNLVFTGEGIGYSLGDNTNPNNLYAVIMQDPYEMGSWSRLQLGTISGNFTSYYYNGASFPERIDSNGNVHAAWQLPYGDVTGFPDMDGMQFKNSTTLAQLENLNLTSGPGGMLSPLEFGFLTSHNTDPNIGFTFYTTEILSVQAEGIGPSASVTLKMLGYVEHPEWDATEVAYSIVFSYASYEGDYAAWGVSISIAARPDDAPDIPEPGTLVLFGTGLLGAAIVARRKMKK